MEQIFHHVINIIFPVLLCILVGFLLGKFNKPFDVKFVTSLLANVGYPSLILAHLVGQKVDLDIFFKMLLSGVWVIFIFIILTALLLKSTKLSFRTYLSPLSLSNVGNIGLPVCALVYGPQGLIYGLAFVVAVTVFNFTIGRWISSGTFSLKQILTSPVIYSVVISVVMLLTKTHLPKPIASGLDILSGLAIPLMLLTLGYSISTMKLGNMVLGTNLALYHLIAAVFITWISLPIFGFEGVARGVFILEGLMPVAASAYLWVSIYRKEDASSVASVILVSTVMTIAVIPIALTYWV